MEIVSWLSKQATKLAANLTSNYQFYVKCHPEGEVDSSSILSLTTFTSQRETAVVPCTYKWIRIRNGIVEERDDFKGNSYVCGLEDVGCTLQVHITSNDPSHPGTAIIDFAEIKLDAVMKQTIKMTISKGFATFYANISCRDQQLQCKLNVYKNQIQIAHQISKNTFTFPYSLSNPMVNLNKNAPNTLDFVFDQQSQADISDFINKTFSQKIDTSSKLPKIALVFNTKKARDQFLLVLKAFNTEKQLKKSLTIHKIQRIHQDELNFDLLMEVQSLRKDLLKMYKAYNKQRQQKFAYFSQNMKLEEEISQIIAAYSVMFSQKIKETQQQINKKQHKRGNSIISLMKSFKELEEQNKALKEAFAARNTEKESKQNQFQYHLILRIQELQRDNQQLKKTVNQLEINLQLQTSTSNLDHSSATLQKYINNINPGQNDLNPENSPLMNEIQRLKDLVSQTQIEKNEWKVRCKQSMSHFEKQKEDYQRNKLMLQNRVNELSQQLTIMKRRDNSMNRSFSLSMELQDYNYEQNKILRDQNDFLLSQAQKLSKLCEKYKGECRRLKQKQKQ